MKTTKIPNEENRYWSDRKPIIGFKNTPVNVEIDKMVPTKSSEAPRIIAKYGRRGILPI